MFRYSRLSGIVFIFLFTMVSSLFAQTQTEQLVITTYYPSPYGSYRQLSVTDNGAVANRTALSVAENNTGGGTSYGVFATNPAASGGTNVGGYFSATNGTTNYGLVVASGNVGLGTTTPGAQLDVNGAILATLPNIGGANATYNNGSRQLGFDVAELFDTAEEVEPGDVLCITTDNKLKKSSEAYDNCVAGIVSGAPAIIFEGSRLQVAPEPFQFTKGNKPPVALAGRVLCNAIVSEGGAIKIGDLLVTSSKPGYAMKGDPEKIKIGTVLGKALESLEEGEGKISVLVTLQ